MEMTDRKRQLIDRAVAGDVAAFEQLFLAERRRLEGLIRGLLPQSLASIIEPADVMQDVFQHAFSNQSTFQPQGDDAVFQWLATIARNHVLNLIRAQTTAKRGRGWTRLRDGDSDEASVVSMLDQLAHYRRSPSASAAAHEMVILMESALERLPDDQRRAVELRYLAGKSVAEVAQGMDRSEAAIKMLCQRALSALRSALPLPADGV